MLSCQVKPTITACVRNSGSAHAERAATNEYAGVEAAETGESDAPERGEGVLCERWDSRRGSVRQLLLYRAQRGRVNARQARIVLEQLDIMEAIIIPSGQSPAEGRQTLEEESESCFVPRSCET
jgi:hypothetical protein